MSKTWEEVMRSRRRTDEEVTVLYYCLLGHMHSERTYDMSVGRTCSVSALDHWDSKRPYGNKDIPMSIAFNLGWNAHKHLDNDYSYSLPDFVKEEAWKLHELVKQEIIENNELMGLEY